MDSLTKEYFILGKINHLGFFCTEIKANCDSLANYQTTDGLSDFWIDIKQIDE
jgi:hypothetical protein